MYKMPLILSTTLLLVASLSLLYSGSGGSEVGVVNKVGNQGKETVSEITSSTSVPAYVPKQADPLESEASDARHVSEGRFDRILAKIDTELNDDEFRDLQIYLKDAIALLKDPRQVRVLENFRINSAALHFRKSPFKLDSRLWKELASSELITSQERLGLEVFRLDLLIQADSNEAINLINNYIDSEPNPAEGHYFKSRFKFLLGEIEEAEYQLDQALELEPDNEKYQDTKSSLRSASAKDHFIYEISTESDPLHSLINVGKITKNSPNWLRPYRKY